MLFPARGVVLFITQERHASICLINDNSHLLQEFSHPSCSCSSNYAYFIVIYTFLPLADNTARVFVSDSHFRRPAINVHKCYNCTYVCICYEIKVFFTKIELFPSSNMGRYLGTALGIARFNFLVVNSIECSILHYLFWEWVL